MLNQTDTAMRSTNFEFIREYRPDLADEAATIESSFHHSVSSAIDLLRTFGQRLAQHFIQAKGKSIRDSNRRTYGLDDLLQTYATHFPAPQRRLFDELRKEGNLQHEPMYQPTLHEERQLRVAWELACWVGKQLGWQNIPIQFNPPPKGGHEFDEMRHQRNEALKRVAEAERACDVSGWICDDQRNLSAPKDFVGREFAFNKINQFLADRVCRVLLIQGEPGFGKTAVIQTFVSKELRAENPPLVYCFEDLSSQGEAKRWIQHLYASVVQQWQLAKDDRFIKNPNEDLVQRLRNRIAEVAKLHPNGRMLFVIDAVDEAGPAKQAVVSFLRSEFPSNVQVIVTARRGYVSYSSTELDRQGSIQVFDLDGPDGLIGRQSDARRYVELKRKDLADEMINEIVRLSDGNFLILGGICRELQDVPTANVTHHLRELGEFKDLRTELYERTWHRLERLTADELRAVEKVAALLAVAHTPLSERTIKATLGFDRADWVKVYQHFREYLKESQRHPPFSAGWIDANGLENAGTNSKSVPVFSLFHQTLRDFVRHHVDEGNLADSKKQLADYCLEQLKKRKPCIRVCVCPPICRSTFDRS